MTAIYGIWRPTEGLRDGETKLLGNALARFGRDSHDDWDDEHVAIGRRLKHLLPEDLFPLDIHGIGKRYAVVADVHLSERTALVEKLGLGTIADTMPDAAIVAAAIERWHEAAFDGIYGSFAIAAWDTQEQRLLLARDHIGARPLFYAHSDDAVVFASMPEGLRALPDIGFEADVDQYARLLRDLPLSPGTTVHKGISRVMPGHYVVVTETGVKSIRYWNPDLTPLVLHDQASYERKLDELLQKAVAATLRGVGPVIGAHLSAGFDSSAVVATAASQLAGTGTKIVAYTAVPKPDTLAHVMVQHIPDEGDLAAETAAMYANIEHVRITPDRGSLDNLDRNAAIYPSPIRNLCNMTWNDAINDAARKRGIRVLLQGSMGNLSISDAGLQALPELMRAGRLVSWFRVAQGLVRNGWMRSRGVAWNTFGSYFPTGFWRRVEAFSGRLPIAARRYSILRQDHYDRTSKDFLDEQRGADRFDVFDIKEYENGSVSSLDVRLSMLSVDVGGQVKAQLGEWGIDCRDPTADRRLIEFSLRVPLERMIWNGEPRALLRKVLRGRVPDSVLDNRKRGLQSADWHDALSRSTSDVRHEVERISMYEPLAELVDLERLEALAAAMPEAGSDRWRQFETELDYRYALLRTISVGSHMRRTARSNY